MCFYRRTKLKHMQLQINNFCNQNCNHCYLDQTPEMMSFENYKIIINKFFYENKGDSVLLIGGEPCLHPDLIEMIKYVPEDKICVLATNGTILTDELIDTIKNKKKKFVQVSIEGTEKIHNEIRGKGNYQKVIAGIKKLREADIEVHISFTVNSYNYKTILDVYKNMYNLDVDFIWADRIIPIKDNFLKPLTTEQHKEFIEMFYAGAKKYKNKTFIWRALQFLAEPDKIPIYSCGIGRHWNVKTDGRLVLCARMPIEVGLNAITDKTEKINQTISCIANYIPKECIGCKYEKKCMGGLKCATWHAYHDLDRKDPNCPIQNGRI